MWNVRQQDRDKGLKITAFGRADVVCFPMTENPTVKGIIGGVPLNVEAESFLEVEGVCGAKRLKSYREEKGAGKFVSFD